MQILVQLLDCRSFDNLSDMAWRDCSRDFHIQSNSVVICEDPQWSLKTEKIPVLLKYQLLKNE